MTHRPALSILLALASPACAAHLGLGGSSSPAPAEAATAPAAQPDATAAQPTAATAATDPGPAAQPAMTSLESDIDENLRNLEANFEVELKNGGLVLYGELGAAGAGYRAYLVKEFKYDTTSAGFQAKLDARIVALADRFKTVVAKQADGTELPAPAPDKAATAAIAKMSEADVAALKVPFKTLEVRVTSKDWEVARNDVGVVIGRNKVGVAVLQHTADPSLCVVVNARAFEPANGSGFAHEAEATALHDVRPVDCGAVKTR